MPMPTQDGTTTSRQDEDPSISRRGWGKHLLLSASALAVLFASNKPAEVQAAPPTDTWKLGGNADVESTNFIGPTNGAPLIIKTAGIERMRVTASGNIGIGNASPTAKLLVDVANGVAVYARHTATSGDAAAVRGDSSATVNYATGVQGVITSTTSGVNAAGVRGENRGKNREGAGVYGSHAGSGYGVHGTSFSGSGVRGFGTSGVYGSGTSTGVYGDSVDGNGVYGIGNTGIFGIGRLYGVEGSGPTGVYGNGGSTGKGVVGEGNYGVFAVGARYGVYAEATNQEGQGVPSAVYGKCSTYGWAGYFDGRLYVSSDAHVLGNTFADRNAYVGGNAHVTGSAFVIRNVDVGGNVDVTGSLSKGSGSFKIDHPLDPANKYLYHSFVESPDMMNIYNGNVTTDANGEAMVTLPEWFDALNRDFRYQLTAIGAPGPNLYVADEIKGNWFRIAGGTAGMKVSWMVTGIRQDAFANVNRIPVEETKSAKERGRYLHPEAFGKPVSIGVSALHAPQATYAATTPQQLVEPESMKP